MRARVSVVFVCLFVVCVCERERLSIWVHICMECFLI